MWEKTADGKEVWVNPTSDWSDETESQRVEKFLARNKQVGGDHYKTNMIQPWDIIDDHSLDFYEGSALKYLLRRKGSRVEDLRKAIHYIEKKIEMEQVNE